MKKQLSICLLLIGSLSGCIGTFDNDQEETISGYLYEDCTKKPIQNAVLTFERRKANLAGSKFSDAGSTVTDANGYFEHTYESEFSSGSIEIERNGSLVVSSEKISGHLGDFYNRAFVSHPVRILTSDSLTENDTLFIGAIANREDLFYITGPFYNNQTFVVDSVGINLGLGGGFGMYPGGVSVPTFFFWDIGHKNYIKTLNTDHNLHDKDVQDVPQAVCGEGGEVVIDLDKR